MTRRRTTGDRIPGYVLGAYPAEPEGTDDKREFYRRLADIPGIGGLEVPFTPLRHGPGELRMPSRLPEHWHLVLTALPATVAATGMDPCFGLASADDCGRAAALAVHREMRDTVHRLAHQYGPGTVRAVLVHSAPGTAEPAALARSLAELATWDWAGARLLVEHCDAPRPGRRPAKGYLTLPQELQAIEAAGDDSIGLLVNWGRSVLEERSEEGAVRHLRQAAFAGRLAGLVFSGVAATGTAYGEPWSDGHLPVATEPGAPESLLTPELAHAAAAEARTAWLFGAKFAVRPRTVGLDERMAIVHASLRALPRPSPPPSHAAGYDRA
ncbi:DUF4862 family protein [Streptomyces sp. NPDC001508]|uniref:DUF4862 family protein n=1 Tax=Streptomyces sp. NPDC001508 TaxID=3154656 RepID=UPI003318F360